MQILVKERLGITLRRVVAWWIDAFLAAAIIIVVRWSVNALFDAPITGRVGAIYDIAALAVVFYLYRVICEARTGPRLESGPCSSKSSQTNPVGGARPCATPGFC